MNAPIGPVACLSIAMFGFCSTHAAGAPAPRHRSSAASTITGQSGPMQAALVGEPTLEFRILPVTAHPGGPYNTKGYYQSMNFTGTDHNVLRLSGGGGRVFLNVFVANWDPDYAGDPLAPEATRVRELEFRVDADGFASGAGGPLKLATQACVNTSSCVTAFGESTPACNLGTCASMWVASQRSDGYMNGTAFPENCETRLWAVAPPQFAFFALTDPQPCGRPDDKPQHYVGSFAVDVPGTALGTYTIDALVAGCLSDVGALIPVLRIVPAIIEVSPCCNRFVSIPVDAEAAGGPGGETAIRVVLSSLYHPDPPPSEAPSPDYSAREGAVRWVNAVRDGQGNAVYECGDSASFGTSYKCVTLGCQPEYRDWVALAGAPEAYLFGDAIIPDSVYDVDYVPVACQGDEENCAAAFGAFSVTTPRWGNIHTYDPLTAVDHNAVIDRVRDVRGALSEPRTMLQPAIPQALTSSVSALDLAAAVDANRGLPYFLPISACPGD